MQNEIKEKYAVLKKTIECPGVCTLTLALARGGIPQFAAGQFITVYFPETKIAEGKAYSISSPPEGSSFSITVRAIGEFSNRLCALNPGDAITASLPYGYFSSEGGADDLVMLAAGIGIAPFRSIIRATIAKDPSRKMLLFYTNRSVADAVFRAELDALQAANPNFSVHYFITRQAAVPQNMLGRRMCAADVIEACGRADGREYMICGPISFVRDMWRGLHSGGVPTDAISTEAFFS